MFTRPTQSGCFYVVIPEKENETHARASTCGRHEAADTPEDCCGARKGATLNGSDGNSAPSQNQCNACDGRRSQQPRNHARETATLLVRYFLTARNLDLLINQTFPRVETASTSAKSKARRGWNIPLNFRKAYRCICTPCQTRHVHRIPGEIPNSHHAKPSSGAFTAAAFAIPGPRPSSNVCSRHRAPYFALTSEDHGRSNAHEAEEGRRGRARFGGDVEAHGCCVGVLNE